MNKLPLNSPFPQGKSSRKAIVFNPDRKFLGMCEHAEEFQPQTIRPVPLIRDSQAMDPPLTDS